MSQYDLNVIMQKIQDKSPFELQNNNRSRERSLQVIISKLYYALEYRAAPAATRKKVTELLLYHGQFEREEIESTFERAARESSDYSKELLEQHPELANTQASKKEEVFEEEDKQKQNKQKQKETIYRFPFYA